MYYKLLESSFKNGTLASKVLNRYVQNASFEKSRDHFELEQQSLFHKGGQFSFGQKKCKERLFMTKVCMLEGNQPE